MRIIIFVFLSLFLSFPGYSQIPDTYLKNESLPYGEVIKYYTQLADKYPEAKLLEYGKTDVGKPLHLFVISPDKVFDANEIRRQKKAVILVNNGIHPGEPEGIDASLHLAEELLQNKRELHKKMGNVVFCIIPVYNIGGALMRSRFNRANQKTPPEHGFRGNARHLDLNRDFVKNATQNSQAFVQIYHEWQPQLFLDTHTTDGSDHQYVMTLIATQHNMLPTNLDNYMTKNLLPFLYKKMQTTPYAVTPYVMPIKQHNPEFGIMAFLDSPMYSTGFAALFNTLGFITENHIFKEFKDRVQSVMYFEKFLIEFANNNAEELINNKLKADKVIAGQKKFAVSYRLDTLQADSFRFKGYHAVSKKSELTGLERLEYDHSKPYAKNIPVFNNYLATQYINAPKAYILTQAYPEVIKRFQLNRVKMSQLTKDTLMDLMATYIDDFSTLKKPFNAHYVHFNVKIHREKQKIQCYKGDYVVYMNQAANRYILQMLEPQGMNSFFKWNFFDEFMEQREYFSPLGFEDNAIDYLQTHPKLEKQYKEAVKQDTSLQKSHYLQLKYIYSHSDYAEKSYRRLPVYRLE